MIRTYTTHGMVGGVVQGATVAVVAYHYTNTGFLGTIFWVGCLIFLLSSLYISIHKREERRMMRVAATCIYSLGIVTTFIKDYELQGKLDEFCKRNGHEVTYETVTRTEELQ